MEATDAGFGDGTAGGSRRRHAPGLAPLPPAPVLARATTACAASADGVPGVWSNTVFVPATERAAFTEVSARGFDAGALLAIHRALLRFAAARGDFLALLSLPDPIARPTRSTTRRCSRRAAPKKNRRPRPGRCACRR